MNFNLTNIRMAESRNGYSMSCTLLINDIEVADFEDKGDGSEPMFYISLTPPGRDLFLEWEAELEKLPPVYYAQHGQHLKVDKAMFIDLLHYALQTRTDFKLLAA